MPQGATYTPTRRFGDEVATLKARIQERVQEAVLDFFIATGVTPDGVEVRMIDATNVGEGVRRYMVGDVSVEFNHL